MSLIGALVPLGKVARKRTAWLGQVVVYTAAGAVSSVLVGGMLGEIGSHLGIALDVRLVIALAMVLAAFTRELGWLRLPLPSAHRQTNPRWRWRFPPLVTSALWGFDVGLFFSTWPTFSGAWPLVVTAFALGDPTFGAVLLVMFWAGRAVSVWLMPLLLASPAATVTLLDQLSASRGLVRSIHVAAIAAALTTLSVWLSEVVLMSG